MDDHSKVNANEVRMPQPLVWAICAICLVPFLLNLGSIQFSSTRRQTPSWLHRETLGRGTDAYVLDYSDRLLVDRAWGDGVLQAVELGDDRLDLSHRSLELPYHRRHCFGFNLNPLKFLPEGIARHSGLCG